jgi:Family of unknown function (DUF6632)
MPGQTKFIHDTLTHMVPTGVGTQHAGIMAIQAINVPAEHGHLLGDIPALIIVAIVLAVLTPRGVVAAKT